MLSAFYARVGFLGRGGFRLGRKTRSTIKPPSKSRGNNEQSEFCPCVNKPYLIKQMYSKQNKVPINLQ